MTPADIDARHPGWHAWRSNNGRWWATSTQCQQTTGSGWTVDAPTLEELDAELAKAGEGR